MSDSTPLHPLLEQAEARRRAAREAAGPKLRGKSPAIAAAPERRSLWQRVSAMMTGTLTRLSDLPLGEVRSLLQDLETHQAELELQNENLRQAQAELAQSRDRISALYDHAPVAYLTLDGEALIHHCNIAAAELLGLSRQALIGQSFEGFLVPATVNAFRSHFRQVAQTAPFKTSCVLDMRSAGRRTLRVRAECTSLIRTASRTDHCHMALIDVTQAEHDHALLHDLNVGLDRAVRERTAELNDSLLNLQAQEKQLQAALDAGHMGTWTVTIHDRLCFVDQRLERLYGRSFNGESLESWKSTLHPDDRERVATLLDRAMQGIDLTFSAEYRVVWPDGSVHWLVGRGQVLFDKDGKPAQVVGVKADMDERKAVELEMQYVVTREQQRIGHELHDDIQQRLTGLGLIAENLCETLASGSAIPMDAAHAVCSRLTHEIGETSTRVSRLSRGLVPVELERDGLFPALHRLARSTDGLGQPKCVFAGVEVAAQDRVAATHLFRIAQEAVNNAVRHSGASRIGIRLSLVRGRGVLTVSDNGCGLPPKRSEGRGLQIMAYRAGQIGATLKLDPSRSGGTQVRCIFTVAGGV